jgi:hypothetical protein
MASAVCGSDKLPLSSVKLAEQQHGWAPKKWWEDCSLIDGQKKMESQWQ